MKIRSEIGQRLFQLRLKNNYSQKKVAEELHISQAAYSLIEASKNGLIAEHVITLSDFYNVPTDYILKGVKDLIRVTRENGFFPYIPVKAHAGFLKNHSVEISEDDYEYYRIPGFSPSLDLKLFEIEGDSMVPSMFPGEIVICQTIDFWKIKPKDAILAITEEAITIKRVVATKGDGGLFLTNDNPSIQDEIHLQASSIKEVLIIRGKISSRLVPAHQIVGKGKVEEMMLSMELLKKEIYELSKKVNRIK